VFDNRKYRLVYDLLADLERFTAAVRSEDPATAIRLAEADLFSGAASLYGEGFGTLFTEQLKKVGCDPAMADYGPLFLAAFLRTIALFAPP
jgi:hypothetical protein